jgi:peptide/nickel transport system permease protein
MRITDSMLSLPFIPVLILFAVADIKQIPVLGFFIRGNNESIAKMVVVLCLFSWMIPARLVRASILSIKEKEFVFAAKNLGASDFRIVVRHITPNILAPLLVAVTLRVGQSIIFEAALSFLGLGVQPPTPTWGNMLFNAQEIIHESPLLAIFPGALIFITVICFNFVGDGLQDAIDPKAIRR